MKLLIFSLLTFLIFYFFKNLGNIIDITTNPIKSQIIVCMGGGKGERLKKSISLLKDGYSSNMLIISSDSNKKDRAKKLKIIRNTPNSNKIVFLEFTKNTFNELTLLKKYLIDNNYNNVIIVSHPSHSRRIDLIIKNFLKYDNNKIEYALVSSGIESWNKKYYFNNKKSLNIAIHELIKINFNVIYYGILINFDENERIIELINKYKYKFSVNLHKFLSFFYN